MIEGSCCCGAVAFEVEQEPSLLGICHCTRCRKLGVSALAFVKRSELTITKGREVIGTYDPSPEFKFKRNFCTKCGTGMGEILSQDESFPISAHLFNDPISTRVKFHEWTCEKPAWLVIGDDAKQFEKDPT